MIYSIKPVISATKANSILLGSAVACYLVLSIYIKSRIAITIKTFEVAIKLAIIQILLGHAGF